MFLRITLPTPTLYDEFIKRLVQKNILPTHKVQAEENVSPQQPVNYFRPTPLAIKPVSKANDLDNADVKRPTPLPTRPR